MPKQLLAGVLQDERIWVQSLLEDSDAGVEVFEETTVTAQLFSSLRLSFACGMGKH